MKRFVIVLIISFIIISLGVVEIVFVKNTYNTIDYDLIQIINKYNDNKLDIKPLEKDMQLINDYWEKSENQLCILFNHKDLNQLSQSFTRIIEYTKTNDFKEAMVELKVSYEIVHKSTHIMGFNIFNIL